MIIPPAGAPPEAPAGAPAGGSDTPILPFEDVPYPSFQIDGGCIITRWNDALVELTGVCRDAAIGSTYEGLIAEMHISHEYRTAAIARVAQIADAHLNHDEETVQVRFEWDYGWNPCYASGACRAKELFPLPLPLIPCGRVTADGRHHWVELLVAGWTHNRAIGGREFTLRVTRPDAPCARQVPALRVLCERVCCDPGAMCTPGAMDDFVEYQKSCKAGTVNVSTLRDSCANAATRDHWPLPAAPYDGTASDDEIVLAREACDIVRRFLAAEDRWHARKYCFSRDWRVDASPSARALFQHFVSALGGPSVVNPCSHATTTGCAVVAWRLGPFGADGRFSHADLWADVLRSHTRAIIGHAHDHRARSIIGYAPLLDGRWEDLSEEARNALQADGFNRARWNAEDRPEASGMPPSAQPRLDSPEDKLLTIKIRRVPERGPFARNRHPDLGEPAGAEWAVVVVPATYNMFQLHRVVALALQGGSPGGALHTWTWRNPLNKAKDLFAFRHEIKMRSRHDDDAFLAYRQRLSDDGGLWLDHYAYPPGGLWSEHPLTELNACEHRVAVCAVLNRLGASVRLEDGFTRYGLDYKLTLKAITSKPWARNSLPRCLRGEDSDPENETWTVEEANRCLLADRYLRKRRDPTTELAWCGVNERSPVADPHRYLPRALWATNTGDTEPYALSGEPPLPDPSAPDNGDPYRWYMMRDPFEKVERHRRHLLDEDFGHSYLRHRNHFMGSDDESEGESEGDDVDATTLRTLVHPEIQSLDVADDDDDDDATERAEKAEAEGSDAGEEDESEAWEDEDEEDEVADQKRSAPAPSSAADDCAPPASKRAATSEKAWRCTVS